MAPVARSGGECEASFFTLRGRHGLARSARSGIPAFRRSSRYFCFIGSRIGVQDSAWTE